MSETPSEPSVPLRADVAICIDHEAMMRLRPVVRHLCVGLVDQSIKVRIITSSTEAGSLSALGPVQLFVHEPLVWPFRRGRLRKIFDFIASNPPAIVYAVAGGAYDVGAGLAAQFDADLVVQVTSRRDLLDLPNISHPVVHRIAGSEPLRQALRDEYGVPDEDVTLIRPGVLRGTEISCFEQPERIPSVVCTSPLEEGMGLHVVIDALEVVRDHGHPLLVFFANTGPAESALRRRVGARRLSANVTFARPTAEPIEILRGADILVVPPGDDAISARPLQAMANGTVVVCFQGGVADYLLHERTAVVCSERTAGALADVLEDLLRNRERTRQLAGSARDYVIEHHPMSAMAEQTASVFRRIMLQRQAIPIRR